MCKTLSVLLITQEFFVRCKHLHTGRCEVPCLAVLGLQD